MTFYLNMNTKFTNSQKKQEQLLITEIKQVINTHKTNQKTTLKKWTFTIHPLLKTHHQLPLPIIQQF